MLQYVTIFSCAVVRRPWRGEKYVYLGPSVENLSLGRDETRTDWGLIQ